jgi:hypothetical protein
MKTIFTGSVKFFDLTFYYINFRNFSSDASQSGIDIVPPPPRWGGGLHVLEGHEVIKSYSNTDTMRADILKENKGKTGIWINKENGKSNIGSAVDLNIRFRSHFSISFLMNPRNNNMKISRALLKYGYSKFSLEILE